MNPYIQARKKQYDALKATIAGIQTRAVEANRDLTEDELRSITEQGEQAKAIAAELKSLAEIETRNAEVAGLSLDIVRQAADGETGEQTRGTGETGGTTRVGAPATTRDRDPGHYRSAVDGGRHSFFVDIVRARTHGDENAARRLAEHARALDTPNEGVGVVPPKWLTSEFELLARQGRRLANAVRNIPLGDDPRPMTLPKQTAGTDAVVAEQAAENDPVGGADAWDSDVDVVTPKVTAGKQTLSRQMFDMADPAIDLLVYGDLMSVYNNKIEAKVGAAMIAAAGAAVTTFATEAAFTGVLPAVPAHDAVIDTAMAVWNARKLPADILAMTVNRWGKFKKLRDAEGRPLIPRSTAGPMNVIGVGDVQAAGQIEELGVIPTEGIGSGSAYPESVLVARGSDTILFESNMLRFRFEEQAGPESIVLGVWAYSAVIVRQAGKSVKRFVITAAA